jgi:glycosyltransferase involved in cell wall biosynthesis
MKILIINRVVPHPESEDGLQKLYLLIQKLYNESQHKIDLALINQPDLYKNYKSLDIQNRDEVDFKNEFKKIKIHKIFLKFTTVFFSFQNISRKLLKFFSLNHYQFYKNANLEKKLFEIIEIINPDIVITLYDGEVLSNLIKCSKNKSFKIISFIGLMDHETQQIRMDNYIRNCNNFLLKFYTILRYKYLVFKLRFFFKEICNKVSQNIFFDTDSVDRAKKLGIKNVEYSKQYTRDFGGEDWFSKRKISNDLLFLNAALTTINVNAADNLIKYIIPHLKDLKNKNNNIFDNLIIVGVENELTNKIKNLNISWIVFTGWVDKISKIFLRSKCIIITNDRFLGSRTKIFHALSCGLPVITHECNTRFHPNLINKINVLIAKDFDHMKILLSEFLSGEINESKLSLNARIAFEKNYKKEVILDLLVNKIENVQNNHIMVT